MSSIAPHNVTRSNDFSGLSALLCNFFTPQLRVVIASEARRSYT